MEILEASASRRCQTVKAIESKDARSYYDEAAAPPAARRWPAAASDSVTVTVPTTAKPTARGQRAPLTGRLPSVLLFISLSPWASPVALNLPESCQGHPPDILLPGPPGQRLSGYSRPAIFGPRHPHLLFWASDRVIPLHNCGCARWFNCRWQWQLRFFF